MNLLTQNTKIKQTGLFLNKKVFNFSIPAYKSQTGKITCPFADKCIKFCYAQKGNYKRFPSVRNGMEKKYELTKQNNFIDLMNKEIKRKKPDFVRVHDSGDYYSPKYLNKWLTIAKDNPNVKFYSYTNSIKFVKDLKSIPNNFDFIFSDSGKQVNLINRSIDRHTKIFNNVKDLIKDGYKNASKIDLFATKWFNASNKVGLIFH
tara:strand:+ start:1458 stop:2069 length:612 start_codon:yes stop_codon:yes gene_type:complete